jgi:hypothetical protein
MAASCRPSAVLLEWLDVVFEVEHGGPWRFLSYLVRYFACGQPSDLDMLRLPCS